MKQRSLANICQFFIRLTHGACKMYGYIGDSLCVPFRFLVPQVQCLRPAFKGYIIGQCKLLISLLQFLEQGRDMSQLTLTLLFSLTASQIRLQHFSQCFNHVQFFRKKQSFCSSGYFFRISNFNNSHFSISGMEVCMVHPGRGGESRCFEFLSVKCYACLCDLRVLPSRWKDGYDLPEHLWNGVPLQLQNLGHSMQSC